MKKKIKSKALLSLGVITTLAATGSVILSCGSSNNPNPKNSDQDKLNGITTEMVTKVIHDKLNPNSTTPAPNAPSGNKYTGITINGLSDVSITVSNWQKVSLGFVSFSIISIDKGTAHVDGAKFGTITISGFASDQTTLDAITTDMVKDAIRAFLAPSSTTPIPDAPADNKFTVSISGLNDVDIHVSNWHKNIIQGIASFSVVSIDKGTATVAGAKFGTIAITGFKLATFTKINSVNSDTIWCILQAQNDKYFIGTNGGLWVSTNGTTFTQVSAGIQPTWNIFSLCKTSDGHIYVGTAANGLWGSKDDGATFTQVSLGTGSTNWDIQTIYQTSNEYIYVGTALNGLWVSIDNGTTFNQVSGSLRTDCLINSIYQTLNGDIFVGTSAYGLWVSKDGGTTFTQVTGELGGYSVLSMHQTLNGQIFVGTDGNGLWVSTTNSGTSFNRVSGGLQSTESIKSICQTSNGDIYVGTYTHGLWASVDGTTFTQVMSGLQSTWVITSLYQSSDNTKLFVATFNTGLWVSQ